MVHVIVQIVIRCVFKSSGCVYDSQLELTVPITVEIQRWLSCYFQVQAFVSLSGKYKGLRSFLLPDFSLFAVEVHCADVGRR